MKLIDVLKANASKLNLLSIDVENDEITKPQLSNAMQNVITELSTTKSTLDNLIKNELYEKAMAKQESLIE